MSNRPSWGKREGGRERERDRDRDRDRVSSVYVCMCKKERGVHT